MDAGVEMAGDGEQRGSGEARTPEAPKQRRGERPRQQIRKAKKVTRRRFSAEDKSARPGIRIVMEGIRGEEPVSVLCQREGIDASVYYRWLKDFMEAGKQRLRGDALRDENARLKQLVADHALDLMALKKGPLAEP